jgi:hypothetical protein
MDQPSVENNLGIAVNGGSAVTPLSFRWAADMKSVSVYGAMPYCTDYVLTVKAGAKSKDAAEMLADASCDCRTIASPGDFDGSAKCTAEVAFFNRKNSPPIMTYAVVIRGETLHGKAPIDFAQPLPPKTWFYKTSSVPPENAQMSQLSPLGDIVGTGHSAFGAVVSRTNALNTREEFLWTAHKPLDTTPQTIITGATKGKPQLGAAGDVNGDGIPDILLVDSVSLQGVRYFLELGGSSLQAPNLKLDDAIVAKSSKYASSSMPIALGDLDGDGFGDVGTCIDDQNQNKAWAQIFFGGSDPTSFFTTSSVITLAPGDACKGLAAGDLNGDGLADLAMVHVPQGGSPRTLLFWGESGNGWRQGKATTDAAVTIEHAAGGMIQVLGDLNADGMADFVIGNPKFQITKGQALIFFGRLQWQPTLDASAAGCTAEGSAAYHRMGEVVRGVGDLDNDGRDDLIIGARNSMDTRVECVFLGNKVVALKNLSCEQADAIISYTP